MEQAIKKAIEGGWSPTGNDIGYWQTQLKLNPNKEWTFGQWDDCFGKEAVNRHLLDPLFWQALGKAEGWPFEEVVDRYGTQYVDWKKVWHRFIDHIAEGGLIDTFFDDILKK